MLNLILLFETLFCLRLKYNNLFEKLCSKNCAIKKIYCRLKPFTEFQFWDWMILPVRLHNTKELVHVWFKFYESKTFISRRKTFHFISLVSAQSILTITYTTGIQSRWDILNDPNQIYASHVFPFHLGPSKNCSVQV